MVNLKVLPTPRRFELYPACSNQEAIREIRHVNLIEH